jgi:fructokinase
MHPEIGHLRLPHDFSRDRFAGSCPYHGDCLEGLASGPAIAARWGRPATDLERGHPAWALEAHYLALGLINLTVAVSPRRIILGGGVMQQEHLFALTRAEFARLMNAYIKRPELTDHLDQYIVPPALKQSAGVLGALVLGEKALVRAREKGRAGVQSHEGAER